MKWISVEDRLPECDGLYITYNKFRHMLFRTYYAKSKRFSTNKSHPHITHWMKRPEPPK